MRVLATQMIGRVATEFGDKRLIDTDSADGKAIEPRWINLARSL